MPNSPQSPRIKVPALRVGDTVGIISPASNIQRDLLERGCASLRQLGYNPFYFDSILDQDLYFAGSVERRARELEEMFTRDEVRAVLCARGGYGTNYLLEALNQTKIVSRPKIFVGYSDVTTLLTYFSDSAGFVTFHGPMVTKDFVLPDGVDGHSWEAALTGVSEWHLDLGSDSGVEPLVEGRAEGILYGGCLSMLAASLGTPYEICTAGTILFARTGTPFTPIIGFDTQNDANDDNDRALINGHVAGRNSFRQPAFFDLDLRLLKAFRFSTAREIDLIAEAFNVTRATNLTFGPDAIGAYGTSAQPVATAGQPLFAPSTARFGGPRQVQLGMRLVF